MLCYTLGLGDIQLPVPDHPHMSSSSWFGAQFRQVIGWPLQKSLSYNYLNTFCRQNQVADWGFWRWVSARWRTTFLEPMKVKLARTPNNRGHGTWTGHHLQPAGFKGWDRAFSLKLSFLWFVREEQLHSLVFAPRLVTCSSRNDKSRKKKKPRSPKALPHMPTFLWLVSSYYF